MEILVCLKQVPDDSVELHLKPGTQEVNLEGVTPVVNAFDTYALEMATRLKEAVGGSITAITIGPEGAKDAVKTCLAVGANQGCLITDPSFEGADTLGKSKILAAAIRKLEADAGKSFDLIFCGREATDKAEGQVGPPAGRGPGRGGGHRPGGHPADRRRRAGQAGDRGGLPPGGRPPALRGHRKQAPL